MRPVIRFLEDKLIERIITEARDILCKLGVEIHNKYILSILADNGAMVNLDKYHVWFTEDIIDMALQTTPESFKLFDVLGNKTHNFSKQNVYFTPGSAALNILDSKTKKIRRPTTNDYINYTKVISQLENIASQSTAFIPADVHEKVSDSYRLYLSLLFCEKPVITGTFTIESFNVMKDFQL
ncbi:trimethylamine methyltransferase family protein, partial [candidate division WOR-3 bacterium]|nr:trimethylamine methyltransferase family protein [candidate division WOR-3 bacterium]